MKNQLNKVAISVDATCLTSDNSGSETTIRMVIASPLYTDFLTTHLDNQVEIDSENCPHSSKPCGGLAHRRVPLRESLGGNIGAKP